jgi:hypothetical protein
MSAAAQTKIFGIRIGLDPKVIVVALLAVAGLLFWYNSQGNEGNATAPARTQAPASMATVPQTGSLSARRGYAANNRAVLSVRKIDPTRGDIDPTLRLDLLARLQKIELGATGRNIFETGPSPEVLAAMARSIRGPVVVPRPIAAVAHPGAMIAARPMVNIPFKYYGFVKPADRSSPNRGFFLDGDNVLVASEGEVLKQRYLVVELTPNTAKMEDVQLKQGQTLGVVPEAIVPQ